MLIALHNPPCPPPHEASPLQVFDAIRSIIASHVVAAWLMPQYASEGAPERLTAVIAVENGTLHPAETLCRQYPPLPWLVLLKSIGTHRAVGEAIFPPMHSLSATQAKHFPALPFSVLVQVFVFGLQLFATVPTVQAASLLTVHATH